MKRLALAVIPFALPGCLPGQTALVVGMVAGLAVGCNRANTVSGQVFVVTRGGENFKLGLVGIHAIGEKELGAIAHDVLEELSTALAKRADFDARRAANIALLSAFESSLDNLIEPGLPAPEALALADESKNRRQKYLEASDWIPILATGGLEDRLFSSLPQAATKTDADGRFTLPVDRGCWLLSRADRMAGSDQERYLWALPPEKAQGRIILANDTLVTDTTALLLTCDPSSSPPPSESAPIKGEADASLQVWVGEAMEKARAEKIQRQQHVEETRLREVERLRLVAEDEARRAEIARAREAERSRLAVEQRAATAEAKRTQEAEKARLAAEVRATEEAAAAVARPKLMGAMKSGIAGTAVDLPVTGEVKVTVRFIPHGTFRMGSARQSERQHDVTLTRSFFMAETECTQAQWLSLMSSNPSAYQANDRPVDTVDWADANEFCKRLTAKQRASGLLPDDWEWSLPTEAQWEYACRAGSDNEPGAQVLAAVAWYDTNSEGATHRVGQKGRNAWGLFDMCGNVSEWCADWYADHSSAPVSDPIGPASGSFRASRGGACDSAADYCRWGFRSKHSAKASRGHPVLGFRAALVPGK